MLRHASPVVLALLASMIAGVASAAPSFDCRRAVKPAERAICRDSTLAQADAAIAALYRALHSRLAGQAAAALLKDQRRFLARRDACGGSRSCLARVMKARLEQLAGQQRGLATPSAAAQGSCNTMVAAARERARTVSVSLPGDLLPRLRAGSELEVGWRIGVRHSGLPLYLVVDTPPEVRFAGMDFYALTAGARGPHGLSVAADRARAIVPLHKAQVGVGGEIYVMPWRSGPAEIGWTIVTAGPCDEQVLAPRRTAKLTIGLGRPHLVVQDPYAEDRPVRRLRDASGRYELVVFDGRYEVHDAIHGGRIFAGDGRDPNFSPTGRFVAARNALDGNLGIIDLVSGEKVLEFSPGLLAWARNDSLVIHGATRFGSVGYAWTLGAHVPTTNNAVHNDTAVFAAGCNQCRAWNDAEVMLNLDAGFFAVITTMFSAFQDLVGGPKDELDSGIVTRVGSGVDDRVRNEMYRRIRAAYGADVRLVPRRWDLGEPLKLSHAEVYLSGPDEGEAYDKSQLSFLVRHQSMPAAAALAAGPGMSAGALRGSGAGARQIGVQAAARQADIVFERIAAALGHHIPAPQIDLRRDVFEPPYVAAPEAAHRAAVKPLIDRILGSAPGVRPRLNTDGHCGAVGEEGLDPAYIKFAWSWRSKGKNRHLLQTECIDGSMRMIYGAVLFVRGDGKSPLRTLDSDLMPEGKMEDGEGPLGLLAGADNELKVFPTGRGQVIVAAPASGAASLIDETTGERIGSVMALHDVNLLTALRLTDDGRHALQLNRDGAFRVHEVKTGHVILLGAHVDDEIVVMTPDGLYDTTFEGAHALHVRFDGAPGLFTVHQFAGALLRPGLGAAILSGRSMAPRQGALPPPPSAELTMAAGAVAGQRTGTVAARSAAGLAQLRIYVDGRLVEERQVSGSAAEVAIRIADPGGARWVTAVVLDRAGLASRPSSVRLPGEARPSGVLRAIAIGVDRYPAEPRLGDLQFAVSDARRFVKAIAAGEGRSTASVETTLLADEAATPLSVIETVARAAKQTGPDDVLVVFYAGHGVDGRRESGGTAKELALTVPGSRADDLAATAIPWSTLAAALDASQGRVVVVLDACHAGLAGADAFASHDAAVQALFTASGAPIVVLAASKGRQLSLEDPGSGGGLFTTAIIEALDRRRDSIDRDGSGLIDFGELYRAVKSAVVSATQGEQTPWLARNGLVGEMALF